MTKTFLTFFHYLIVVIICRRQFVVPRVLRSHEEVESEEGSENEENDTEQPAPPKNAFCEDPSAVRARRERQWADRMQQRGGGSSKGRGGGSSSSSEKKSDVVGKNLHESTF